MNRFAILGMTTTLALSTSLAPVLAQGRSVQQNAMERSHWYNSPREIQILDERPTVRDFREAPVAPPTLQIPNGPVGSGGVLPTGGLPVGGGPGWRAAPMGSSPVPLPKSGFGSQTNIPVGLMSPRGLPKGTSTGSLGNMGKVSGHAAAPSSPARTMANRPLVQQRPQAPQQMMTYGPSGYGGGSVGSSSQQQTKTGVRGTLLSKVK